jgi:hypothetical protein
MTQKPSHETLLLELTEQAYNLWRHNPITSAYLSYLNDLIESFRTAAADMVENGIDNLQAEVLRGRILTLRELHTLKLEHIQNFYRNQESEETLDDSLHQRN